MLPSDEASQTLLLHTPSDVNCRFSITKRVMRSTDVNFCIEATILNAHVHSAFSCCVAMRLSDRAEGECGVVPGSQQLEVGGHLVTIVQESVDKQRGR